MKYSITEIHIEKKQPVTFVLENMDNIEHDIEIKIPKINENNLNQNNKTNESIVHLHAEPNSTENITFTPVGTGVYEYICTIPGHKESGMVGRVVVE